MPPPVTSLTVSNRPGSSATFVLTSLPQPASPKLRSPVRHRASRFGATPSHRPPERRLVQARRESNPQPPVLETGALPIELLAFVNCRCRLLIADWSDPAILQSAICNYLVSL